MGGGGEALSECGVCVCGGEAMEVGVVGGLVEVSWWVGGVVWVGW